ncbi:MAG: DUF5979 domain-containing protein [Lentilactobacillus buchneri]|jgi:LPXTG-motif cell wall-anchored protein|nr:DUF5979 domain-containing protein [Lentilactobacillus buchneri]MCI2019727.1 DUF5979 domain-containing protein [Lentilactobacillus buchneri]
MWIKKRGVIIQVIGVLTLLIGNFFTAGQALADAVSTDEIAVENAKFVNQHQQFVSNSKVGDRAQLSFDLTVGAISKSGAVTFGYDEESLTIKKKRYRYTNGQTVVVVDVDGKDSTIHWRNAVGRTNMEVKLPVKFRRAMNQHRLTVAVDHKLVKLPFLTIVSKENKPKQNQAGSSSGNLKSEDKVNNMLQQERMKETQKQVQKAQAQSQESQSKGSESTTDESEKSSGSISQSNQTKSQSYLEEKRKNDQKKAAVNNKKAIAENDDNGGKVAESSSSVVDNAATTPGSSKAAKSVAIDRDVTTTSEALKQADAEDAGDADGDVPSKGANIRNEVKNAQIFAARTGQSLNDKIDTQFFSKITLGMDNQTIDIPAKLGDGQTVTIPEQIHGSSKNVITWHWDTTSIEEMNSPEFEIEDGDYFDFVLSGFKFDYDGKDKVTQEIVADGVKIGEFTVSPYTNGTGEVADNKHNIRITFLTSQVPGHSTISYGASLATTFDKESSEISFGEIAGEDAKIEVEKATISLKKDGEFYKDNGVVDYNKLHWTSTFKVENKDSAADKVVLTDTFGNGYQYGTGQNQANYIIRVTGNKGTDKLIELSDISHSPSGKKIDFTFDAAKLVEKNIFNEDEKITSIVLETIGEVTSATQTKFLNTIQVTDSKINDQKITSAQVETSIERESTQLDKTAKVQSGGNVRYKVRFTVDGKPNNFTMTDKLNSKKFSFAPADSYILNLNGDSTNSYQQLADKTIISDENGYATLTINFNDKIPQGTHYLYYDIIPKDEATSTDYKNLKNLVQWNGQEKYSTIQNPIIDEKKHLDSDWSKMTTDWGINVNQINRKVTGDFVITEPHGDAKYLDFEQFYNEHLADNIKDINKYLRFFKNNVSGEEYKYKYENGKFSWIGKEGEAFRIAFSGGKMTLTVLNLPDANHFQFGIGYYGVPLDKDAIAEEMPEEIYNRAQVSYNGENNEVAAKTEIPRFMSQHLTKSGRLSENFHEKNGRHIDWKVSFNHMGYLGEGEALAKLLTEDGIDITDIVGTDQMTGNDDVSEVKTLQDISNLLGSLRISLAELAKDGSGYGGAEQLLKDTDYEIVKGKNEKHEVTFKLKLTESGLEKYNVGKTVFVLDFQAQVPSLGFGDNDEHEHFKKWLFHNKITLSGLGKYGDLNGERTANATVSYTDNGHLLDKSGQSMDISPAPEGRTLPAIKWQVVINGDGRKINSKQIKVTDSIANQTHHHLITHDPTYQLTLFKANRSIGDDGKVTYTAGDKIQRDSYKLDYSDSLDNMTITFDKDVIDGQPILVQYYTVRETSTANSSFENKVTLEYGDQKIIEKEKIKSETSAWGSYERFAVNVVKSDAKTGKRLEGVMFMLERYDKATQKWVPAQYLDGNNEKQDMVETTDEYGMASFNNLGDKAVYRVVETQGLSGYYANYTSPEFRMSDLTNGQTVHVLNVENPKMKELIIKKNVQSSDPASLNDRFNFEVQFTNKDGKIDENVNGRFDVELNGEMQSTQVTFIEGVSQGLPGIKNGETLKIKGLPVNAYYRVIETNGDGYKTTHGTDQLNVTHPPAGDGSKKTGVLAFDDSDFPGIVTFTNTLDSGEFEFSKTIRGENKDRDKDREFKFELQVYKDGKLYKEFNSLVPGIKHQDRQDRDVQFRFENGKSTQLIDDKDNKNIVLKDGESYRKIKLPGNVQLVVREKHDDIYSKTFYKLNNGDEKAVEVDHDGFHVVGPISMGSHVKFINEHKENQFEFEKIVSGRDTNDTFTFDVTAGNEETRNAVKSNDYVVAIVNAATGESVHGHLTVKIVFNDQGKATGLRFGDQANVQPINLQNNQKLIVKGLPTDAGQFKIKEIDYQKGDWTVYNHIDGEFERAGDDVTLNLNREKGRNSVMFRNTPPDCVPFTLKKVASGLDIPKDKAFEFDLTITNPNSEWGDKKTFKAIKSGETDEQEIVFSKAAGNVYHAKVSLKVGQTITFFMMKGLKMTITEDIGDDYHVSHQYGGDNWNDGKEAQVTTGSADDCGTNCLPPLVFKNHRPGTSLEIRKVLKGALSETDFETEFEFKINVVDKEDRKLDGEFDITIIDRENHKQSGTVTLVDGNIKVITLDKGKLSTLKLRGDERAVITGLPDGAKVKVIETSQADFKTSHAINTNAEVTGNETINWTLHEDEKTVVQFMNEKLAGGLKITKRVIGDQLTPADKDRQFEFYVTTTPELADKTYQAVKRDQHGNKENLRIKFTDGRSEQVLLKDGESMAFLGLPTNVKYSVREIIAQDMRADYDVSYRIDEGTEHQKEVTEYLGLEHGRAGHVTFYNAKNSPKTANLQINKKVDGDGMSNLDLQRSFSFRIKSDITLNETFTATKQSRNGHTEEVGIEFKNGIADLTLKSSESLVVMGLPINYHYQVTETKVADFSTSYQVNGGQITAGNATENFKMVNKQNGLVNFVNHKEKSETASMEIAKRLAGTGISEADKDLNFKFVVYTNAYGDFKATKIARNGHSEEVTVSIRNGQSTSIYLKGDESILIKDLPISSTYQVGEAFAEGFAASYQVNSAGKYDGMMTDAVKLVKDQAGKVTFTNTKDMVPAEGTLIIDKFVNNLGNPKQSFTFNIEMNDGAGGYLNGIFQVEKVKNGVSEIGQIALVDGKGTFQLTHGQTIKLSMPLGTAYNISEQDYQSMGYVTTTTKNRVAMPSTTVTGTVTAGTDHLIYHNDIKDDLEGTAPLPGQEDSDDGSATLEGAQGLPGNTSDNTSGADGIRGSNGVSGSGSSTDAPSGIPSQGYTGKAALPQTGEDINQQLIILGLVLLMAAIGGMVYYKKRVR